MSVVLLNAQDQEAQAFLAKLDNDPDIGVSTSLHTLAVQNCLRVSLRWLTSALLRCLHHMPVRLLKMLRMLRRRAVCGCHELLRTGS